MGLRSGPLEEQVETFEEAGDYREGSCHTLQLSIARQVASSRRLENREGNLIPTNGRFMQPYGFTLHEKNTRCIAV